MNSKTASGRSAARRIMQLDKNEKIGQNLVNHKRRLLCFAGRARINLKLIIN